MIRNKSFEEVILDLRCMYGIELSDGLINQIHNMPIEPYIPTPDDYKLPDELFRVE